jgi:hypothetical protein
MLKRVLIGYWNLPGDTEEIIHMGQGSRQSMSKPGVKSGICLMQVRKFTALAKLLGQMMHAPQFSLKSQL